MADTALQRKNMVESQVRPSDVTDRRITRAMLDVPREAFVPERVRARAYSDADIPLPGGRQGRSLLAPRTLAKLIQLAAPESSDKVLIVGAAGGYSAAVVARLAQSVVALECDPALAKAAQAAMAGAGIGNVRVVEGDLAEGSAPDGPFGVIIVEGRVDDAPVRLIEQLAEGGRLVAITSEGAAGHATRWQRTKGAVGESRGFDAMAALLPGFERAAAFVF